MSSTVVNQLKKIISEELDVNLKIEEIDENAPLFEDGLGFDSIATVELISLIEKNFQVSFTDAELTPDCFKNLNVLGNFVSQKMEIQKVGVAG